MKFCHSDINLKKFLRNFFEEKETRKHKMTKERFSPLPDWGNVLPYTVFVGIKDKSDKCHSSIIS